MADVEKFWNKVSKNYDKQVYSKHADGYNEVLSKSRKYIKNTDCILDFACGTGETAIQLCKDASHIHGIDISENMIDICNGKAMNMNISNVIFEKKSIFDDSIKSDNYDMILAYNVLYFIEDVDVVLKRINELIRPGGYFISTTNCFGEKKNFNVHMQMLLSKLGTLPYMAEFKTSYLENIIQSNNFEIIETCEMHKKPSNYFVVAKKR